MEINIFLIHCVIFPTLVPLAFTVRDIQHIDLMERNTTVNLKCFNGKKNNTSHSVGFIKF